MDLDARQTRDLFLAGAAAFPTPFPNTGAISLERGNLTYSRRERPRETDLVIVQEFSQRRRSKTRVVLQEHVSALFVPGRWRGQTFRISRRRQVHDLDRGEWFLGGDVNATEVRGRLRLRDEDDITTRHSILRGIVFVAGYRPVITISECIELARYAARRRRRRYCDPDRGPYCDPDRGPYRGPYRRPYCDPDR